jgi:DNA-directed RNA polymerase specialized sigma24 family protein
MLTLQDDDSQRALELDVALTSLEARDAALARLVEWRFFAGMSFQQIAELSGRSERSLRRDWELARVYLQRRLREHDPA